MTRPRPAGTSAAARASMPNVALTAAESMAGRPRPGLARLRRVHVGLNLVFLVPGEQGGMEVYARELLRALPAQRPDIRLTAFVNREARAAGGGGGGVAHARGGPGFAPQPGQGGGGGRPLLPGAAPRARR